MCLAFRGPVVTTPHLPYVYCNPSAPATGDQLGGVKLSQDHRLLAYSLKMHTGPQEAAEQYCCVVRDIHAGRRSCRAALAMHMSTEQTGDYN
jgi:hypothetical protein